MDTGNTLIVNSEKGNLLKEITDSLETCNSFLFSVAFVNYSGLQLLLDPLKNANNRGVRGKIITSTYLNFTDPKALSKLKEFNNIDLKIFITDKEIGFHTKAYIFEFDEYYKIIIGSSNITQNALKSNIEWNVKIISKNDKPFTEEVLTEFNTIWGKSLNADEELINEYRTFISNLKKQPKTISTTFERPNYITPNTMQQRALKNLSRLRAVGERKALVIAATGTGKTFMSAFDVKRFKPKKLLFVVHREEILNSAKMTFEYLLSNENIKCGLFTGNEKDRNADYLFATRDSLSRHYREFDPHEFDYLIIDEAHHATSDSYQTILNYFNPAFTLGMTATPERSDNYSIFELFDNNVAIEIRLHEALEEEIILPFHYFGITDIESIDLSDVPIDNIDEITKRLKVNERVDFIINKINFYGHDGEKTKCLGFCASKEHAKYMADEFNMRGYKSVYLTGEDSVSRRKEFIKRLEDNDDDLNFIFTVDIFNEGVDIPSVNLVLMLRPTNSPIVFIQQLGRGLRKHDEKEFLTVLDFIGNHQKTFLIAIALNGRKYYDKESLKVAISTDFAQIPGATHIQMDEISKDRILAQIDKENFISMKYLKEEYSEFKKLNNGQSQYYLMNYLKFESAPDPVKFIKKKKSYLRFVADVDKDEYLKKLLLDDEFEDTIEFLSSFLPLRRPYEFAILKRLITQESLTVLEAKNEILKIVEDVEVDSIKHSFEFLNQDFFDHRKKKTTPKLALYKNSSLSISEKFINILKDDDKKQYILDILNYGLHRYETEFKHINYGLPFLKLYEEYKMMDVALLSNYRKTHSAFRGSGLIPHGNNYYLFIDLHKDEDIKDSINYLDQFKSPKFFQWQTPNKTRQTTETGKNIIYNVSRDINLHLFVRKYREIEPNVAAPYIYIGKGNTVKFEGEQPITTILELEHEVPANLYREFTEKV